MVRSTMRMSSSTSLSRSAKCGWRIDVVLESPLGHVVPASLGVLELHLEPVRVVEVLARDRDLGEHLVAVVARRGVEHVEAVGPGRLARAADHALVHEDDIEPGLLRLDGGEHAGVASADHEHIGVDAGQRHVVGGGHSRVLGEEASHSGERESGQPEAGSLEEVASVDPWGVVATGHRGPPRQTQSLACSEPTGCC